jgi:YD repeat-containing protein
MSAFPVTDDLGQELGLTESAGAVVSRVEPGTPADIGGLERFDVILDINDEPVESVLDFYRLIGSREQDEWRITVYRDGQEQILTVVD